MYRNLGQYVARLAMAVLSKLNQPEEETRMLPGTAIMLERLLGCVQIKAWL